MKKLEGIIFFTVLCVFALTMGVGNVLAVTTASSTEPIPQLTTYVPDAATGPAINLFAAINVGQVAWTTNSTFLQGYKVIWSKSSGPSYPVRFGDHLHTLPNANATSDTLTSFLGAGTYYVRVCGLVGGVCGVYSNEITIQFGVYPDSAATTTPPAVNPTPASSTPVVCPMIYFPVCGIDGVTYANSCVATAKKIAIKANGACYASLPPGQMATDTNPGITIPVNVVFPPTSVANFAQAAQNLFQNKLVNILSSINLVRSSGQEQQIEKNYLPQLQTGLKTTLTASSSGAIVDFIAYGVDANTVLLGAGQRAAAVNSFQQAFGVLPTTQAQLEDMIKIANGRWPSATSSSAEAAAKTEFKTIYLRTADMTNAHDASAIKIIAYGLQQQAKNRNLKSEAAALKTFKAIFNRLPSNTLGWNTLAAITYSGATR